MHEPQVALVLLLQIAAAILLDILLGRPRLLGRVPGPDSLLHTMNIWLSKRLDRARRSDANRIVRGLLALLALSCLLWPFGAWLDSFTHSGGLGIIFTTLLLTLLIGQRAVWDTTKALCNKLKETSNADDKTRYGAARWAIERINIRFADGLVANTVIYVLFGFSALLIYRALTMVIAVGSPNGVKAPNSPYFFGLVKLYNFFGFLMGSLAGIIQRLAAIFVPKARPFAGFPALGIIEDSLAARRIPLMTMAHTLGYNFKLNIEVNDSNATWIGPGDGKARLNGQDIKRALLLAWISTGLLLLVVLSIILAFNML